MGKSRHFSCLFLWDFPFIVSYLSILGGRGGASGRRPKVEEPWRCERRFFFGGTQSTTTTNDFAARRRGKTTFRPFRPPRFTSPSSSSPPCSTIPTRRKKGEKEDSIVVGPLHHHYSDAFALSAPLAVTVWKKEKRGSLEAEKRSRGRGTLCRLSGGLSQRRSPLGGERGRRGSLHLLFLFFGKGMGKRGWGGCKEASIASISFSWR